MKYDFVNYIVKLYIFFINKQIKQYIYIYVFQLCSVFQKPIKLWNIHQGFVFCQTIWRTSKSLPSQSLNTLSKDSRNFVFSSRDKFKICLTIIILLLFKFKKKYFVLKFLYKKYPVRCHRTFFSCLHLLTDLLLRYKYEVPYK